jgi:valyl-tRNA synthetase
MPVKSRISKSPKKTSKRSVTARRGRGLSKTMKRGGFWPFDGTVVKNSQSIYDQQIAKYRKQIEDLNTAIKTLEAKIANMEIAKKANTGIADEKAKLTKLEEEKKTAMKNATGGFLSSFANFFK